ncbi:hypothetical protein [Paraburkholderia sp. 2C]
MRLDWRSITLAAKRANAAYLDKDDQSKRAYEAIGDVWLGQYETATNQAVVSRSEKGYHLSISGTRASQLRLLDVFADVSLDPVGVMGGAVTEGVLTGMDEVWSWAKSLAPADAAWNVSGHSLGASRTHLTPLFVAVDQIGELHSFEAPKFCDAQFYQSHAAALANMVCVLHGRDTWAAWPWLDARWQSRPLQDHVWLKSVRFSVIPAAQWPGAGSMGDHDMDDVEACCAKIEATESVTSAV